MNRSRPPHRRSGSSRPPRPSAAKPAPKSAEATLDSTVNRTGENAEKHPNRQAANGRWLALQALLAFQSREVFVSRILDDLFQQTRMHSRDRRLATELANETVRRLQTLDHILTACVSRPRENVEPEIWTVLQLGCLQLVCLPSISPHAAIHETVELCDLLRRPHAKGFVNGVLRNLQRTIQKRESQAQVSLSTLTARQLPLQISRSEVDSDAAESQASSPRQTEVVTFTKPFFTPPEKDRLAYISQVVSLPEWLLQRLMSESGGSHGGEANDWDALLRMGLWLTTVGRMSLRVNLLQTTREKVLDVLQAAGVPAHAGELPEAIHLEGSVAIIDLPGYREGWFSVQDPSAMSATDLLHPQPGETILDLCAAPGGKTTHLAERMQNQGLVLACDIVENRLKTITENARRLRLDCIETLLLQEDASNLHDRQFDAVLADVPCSNTGVLGKRPEARWRLLPISFRELIPLQMQLLRTALERTRPGGRVVYSTCSIDPEENRGVVDAVLAQYPNVQLVEERQHHPGSPADGGYQALLVKS